LKQLRKPRRKHLSTDDFRGAKCYTNGMRYKLLCPQCGREFIAARSDAKRCSSSCRVYAFRSIPPALGVGERSKITAPPDNAQRRWAHGPTHKQDRANFVELPPLELLRLSDAELRDYCARLDAARGLVNGSPSDVAVAAAEVAPILREPQRPPEGAPLQVLNDYYALKKRWNEQQKNG
jgi:hypothetical protein